MRAPVEGYEGFYEVDDQGNVFSLDRVTTGRHGTQIVKGRKLALITHKGHGYSVVNLAMYGKTKQHRVHILVARAFIPNPENKPTVNHRNGIKKDCRKSNLEWATHQEQMDHAAENNLTAKHTRNGAAKLTDEQIREAYARCMAGEELQEVSQGLGVNRNTLPKAFDRLGLTGWKGDDSSRKSAAANKRWYGHFRPQIAIFD